MKKALGILLAVVLVLAFSVPVMADVPPVETHVTVEENPGGDPPIIKAKWEKFSHYLDSGMLKPDRPAYTLDYMTYDDDPLTPGMQVFPPGQLDPQGEIDIEFWAVVTDPQGLADIVFVAAHLYNPDGTEKYKVGMLQVCANYLDPAVKAEAFAEMEAADAAGAITYNEIMDYTTDPPTPTGVFYTLDDLKTQYEKNEAWIFMGVEWLDYHQVHGMYTVEVCVADQKLHKECKTNTFEYVKEASIAIDFDTIDFGIVEICKEKTISGDEDMTTPDKPTVKNLGNCDATINVHFDDMGLGWRTEGGVQVPNVSYDARLGLNDPVPVIWPSVDTALPGLLPLCNMLELDFSIHVSQAQPGEFTGTCTIWATDP